MLNKKSLDLILEFEVGGGENYYNKFLKNPSWPGEQSGVTIGVGYDLGYVNKQNSQMIGKIYLKKILIDYIKSLA